MNAPTKALLCGALLAAVLPALEQAAQADPLEIPLTTNVTGDADDLFSTFAGAHLFGGPATVLPVPGAFYSITVTSGLSDRPGWTYELSFDYANFGLGFFQGNPGFNNPQLEVTAGLKNPSDPNFITEYTVKDFGGNPIAWTEGALHNLAGGMVHILVDVDDVAAGGAGFTIQWNQVPAPGALALLGVAGLVGKRRRRN